MHRAEALRPARRSPRSLTPRLAAGDAPTGAQPATFDLGSGPYGWHGTGRITTRSIAGAARRASAKRSVPRARIRRGGLSRAAPPLRANAGRLGGERRVFACDAAATDSPPGW